MIVSSPRKVQIGLSSDDLKDALRDHHPAFNGPSGMQWVCLSEWMRIDLLAIECWRQARVVGYEVKVSRSDMRAELLDPTKRYEAVSRCTQFYFAVPAGMLKPDELDFVEPDWTFEDFKRQRCTNKMCSERRERYGWHKRHPKPRGPHFKGTDREGATIDLGSGFDSGTNEDGSTYSHHYQIKACCPICRGYGTVARSRVEEEAPQLWVPRDVGLVEVDGRGARVVRQAPLTKEPKLVTGAVPPAGEHENRLARHGVAEVIRWASFRPDPRHAV